jgi:cytochrome P450
MSHPNSFLAGDEMVDLPVFDAAYRAEPQAVLRSIAPPERPLRRVRLPTGTLVWVLTDYHLARAVLTDRRFSKATPGGDQDNHYIFRHMLFRDPPEHTRLRLLVAPYFQRSQAEERRGEIQTYCDSLVAQLQGRQSIDVVSDFATPLALRTICSVVGFPPAAEPRVQEWSERLIDADFDDQAMFPVIAQDIVSYIEDMFSSNRASEDSVFAHLARKVRGGRLTKEELSAMIFLILNAGYETSVNLISAGILTLLQHPAQWRAICLEPSLVPNCVQEVLRLVSPLQMTTARFATEAVHLSGYQIDKGDIVFVALCAANRDSNQFPEPDVLDVKRAGACHHIGFGHGVHYCLGAQLAQTQAEIALATFSRTFPNVTYDDTNGPPAWDRGFVLRGLISLPVKLHRGG